MPADALLEQYGQGSRLCPCANDQITLVFSQEYPFDLVELEQLLEAVGWSRRPIRRVRKALSHSLLKVGLWRHDPRVPRLVGFARCTGVGIGRGWLDRINPDRQGADRGRAFDQHLEIGWPRLPHLLQHLLTVEATGGLQAHQPAQAQQSHWQSQTHASAVRNAAP